jgi:ABC-type sugar transport system ATPase subunit
LQKKKKYPTEENLEITDCFTILRDGRFVTSKPVNGITVDEIITGMAGRTLTYVEHQSASIADKIVMEADGITRRGICKIISIM